MNKCDICGHESIRLTAIYNPKVLGFAWYICPDCEFKKYKFNIRS